MDYISKHLHNYTDTVESHYLLLIVIFFCKITETEIQSTKKLELNVPVRYWNLIQAITG